MSAPKYVPTMHPLSADITTKLRTLRKMQRISAQALADRVTAGGYRVGRGTIASYEIGRADVLPLDYAARAAEVLATTLAALLTGSVECPACHGAQPEGFTCNTCGGAA